MDSHTEHIAEIIKQNDVLLFMKGTPEMPRCGFSATVVKILHHLNVGFSAVDVLEDEQLRQQVKEYSNWPTIPQLYIKGEFLGGCDILRDMVTSGELVTLLGKKDIAFEVSKN